MSLATFKDLCIDAVDAHRLGDFWAGALGLACEQRTDGNAALTGPTSAHTVWINQVPEPKTVRHRVHLDVHVASIDRLVALGATVIDDQSFRWTVMTDPDGGEFCAFVREQTADYRLYEIVVGCTDHGALSMWWSDVIGGRRVLDDRGFSYLEQVPGVPFDAISFVPVPEARQTKNRVHLDLVAAEAGTRDELIDVGATLVRARDDEISWDVLADPEGNEFCVFPADWSPVAR